MSDFSLESLFGDSELDIECPICNKSFEVLLQDVMESGSTVVCPHCEQEITIDHDETTEQTLKDGNKALNEFEKALKGFK